MNDGQNKPETNAAEMAGRHRAVAVWCAAIVVSMAGLSYAAVPLYRMFCQITGYGGTTRVAVQPSAVVLDRTITVRFDANTGRGLPWEFQPVARTQEVKLGETSLAHYTATNTSDKPVMGTAAFNVTPEIAGAYFNKIQCFCFTEQRLEPGQTVDMPVTFFVDPAIASDKDAQKISQITLSYTFYPLEKSQAKLVNGTAGNGG